MTDGASVAAAASAGAGGAAAPASVLAFAELARVEFDAEARVWRTRGQLSEMLGLEYTEVTPQRVRARLRVDARHQQPVGLLHGGINAVIAEELGSFGASLNTDMATSSVVGTSVTAHHVSSARPGDTLECTATPAHVGKRAQLWTVRIESGGRLVALCTLSAMVTARPLHEREAMRVALGEAEARALERARRGADAAPAALRSKL